MDAEVAKRQFLEYIEIERGRAVKTIENYDHYLTRYFSQMGVKNVSDITEEKIELAKLPERQIVLIASAELERLLKAPEEALEKETDVHKKIAYLRDRAILELLFSTGLRVSDLFALNCDLDLSRDELSVP